jgi:hypothetical protein
MMAWTIETLDAIVDAEIAALPGDLRARLARIGFLIEDMGLERLREPYPTSARPALGDPLAGQRPDRSGSLRDGDGPASGHRSGVHQEDAEDAAA